MKIVTFNIRCDHGQDENNNFEYRTPLIRKKIQEEQPDILCFQEVLPHVAVWLKEELTDYYVIGCGRSETFEDEQMTVAYRKSKLNLIKIDTFWLSETPLVPGSRYDDQSACPRTCTEAVFQDFDSGKMFRLINTHLDHIGPNARKLGLSQIMRKLAGESFFPEIPVMVLGDLNAEPEELSVVMNEYPEYVNFTENIGITFHGFGKAKEPSSIDYIYAKGDIKLRHICKWTDMENGVYLSDHYPVCAEVLL